jgi:hypothetical protein
MDELGLDIMNSEAFSVEEKKPLVEEKKRGPKIPTWIYFLIIPLIIACFGLGMVSAPGLLNESALNESYDKGFSMGEETQINLTISMLTYAANNCKFLALNKTVSFVSTNCLR